MKPASHNMNLGSQKFKQKWTLAANSWVNLATEAPFKSSTVNEATVNEEAAITLELDKLQLLCQIGELFVCL